MCKLFDGINCVIDVGKYLTLSYQKRHYIKNCIKIHRLRIKIQ